jgi:hypothetical protein
MESDVILDLAVKSEAMTSMVVPYCRRIIYHRLGDPLRTMTLPINEKIGRLCAAEKAGIPPHEMAA